MALAFMNTSLGLLRLHLFIFSTLTVCLSWQPAVLGNNKASVEVSKQLMAWGTEGTPTVAVCNLPGWWSEQARTKASLFAGKLETQCVSCVFLSLPSPGWKWECSASSPEIGPGQGPIQSLTCLLQNWELEKGPHLSMWTAYEVTDSGIFPTLTMQNSTLTWPNVFLVYVPYSYSHKLLTNFSF